MAHPTRCRAVAYALLRHERLCCVLALLIACGWWSSYKLSLVKGSPRYHADTEAGFFYSESAIHYRLYEMIADPANDWTTITNTLPLDKRAQWPEGLPVLEELPFGMEMFYGLLHRWLAPLSVPHVFLLNAIAVYTGLALICVFLMGQRVTGSCWWGLFGAVLYATLEWSFVRTVRGAFYYEDFAMPFLLGAIALMLPCPGRTPRPRSVPVGVLAGVIAACAAAFWHVSQYPLAATAGLLSLRAACRREHDEGRFAAGLTAGFAVGAVVFPVLRAKVFLLSLPMAVAVQWALWASLRKPDALPRRLALWATTLAGLVLAVTMLNPKSRDYSHVFEYVLARLRFIAGPPDDPAAMGFVARAFWEGPFLWASPREIVDGLRAALVALPLVFVPFIGPFRKRWSPAIMGCLALFFLAMGIGMRRFLILAAPFVAVSVATGFSLVAGRLSEYTRYARGLQVWKAVAILLIAANGLTMPRAAREGRFPPPDCYWPVMDWLRTNAARDEAFFCRMASSAVILQGTGLPSVVQPIWESKWARVKYEGLMTAAFRDEDTLWEALRRYDTTFFLYDFAYALGTGPRSEAYMSGVTGPPTADRAVVACHFYPERLRRLDLVYQDNAFRVFRVRDEIAPEEDANRLAAIGTIVDNQYSPINDPRNFAPAGDTFTALDNGSRIGESLNLLTRGEGASRSGDTELAEDCFRRAIALCSNNLHAEGNLALLELSRGNIEAAKVHVTRCREIAPRNREVIGLAARIEEVSSAANAPRNPEQPTKE